MNVEKIFKLVFKFITHRGMRSFLTTVGIAIGVALMFSLISINKGMVNFISGNIEQLGSQIVTVSPKFGTVGRSSSFTSEEVDAVRSLPSVNVAAGIYSTVLPVSVRRSKDYLVVYGYDSEDIEALSQNMPSFSVERGRFLRKGERGKIVVGYLFAEDNNLGLGSIIKVSERNFRIVGILAPIGNKEDDNSLNTDVGDLWDITGETGKYNYMIAKVSEINEDRIKRAIKRVRGREDFEVFTPESMMETIGQLMNVINSIFLAIAGVSVVVGSIGIANTMYMAVFERTREIGIMKAVGASQFNILLIFLLESGMLSLIGGFFGIVLGFVIALFFSYLIRVGAGLTLFHAAFTLDLLIFSMGLSFIIGVLSGFFPARYASKLEPVEALRYE